MWFLVAETILAGKNRSDVELLRQEAEAT